MKASCSFLIIILLLPLSGSGQNGRQTACNMTRQQDSLLESIMEQVYNADYIKARKLAIQSLEYNNGNILFHASILGILGDIETATGNRGKAFSYYRRIETIFRKNPDLMSRMCVIAWKYANLYYESKQYDSAYYYARYAIDSSRVHLPSKHNGMLSANLPIIGYHYYLQGDYETALSIYNEAIAVNKRIHSESENVHTFLKIADLKAKKSDYRGAVKSADEALQLASTSHIQQYRLAAVSKLVDIHRQFGNYKEAAHYLQLKMDLIDEINLADQKKSLRELEARFHSKLKEQENKALKISNRKKQRENNSLLIIILLSVIAAVAILIFAVIFFAQKRKISKEKANVDRLNKLNQKIFSVISHDFRGLIMGLDLMLDLQEKYGPDPGRFAKQSGQLRSDLRQANLILENLLNWSRTELGSPDLSEQECSTAAVGKAVIKQLKTLIETKQLTIINALPPNQVIPVSADSFTIILRNLLSNAIKYSHEGGKIVVDYNSASAEFEVRDYGIGMDAFRQEQLFKEQLHPRLGTQHETGFGIGLNLVYELLHKNEGYIRVESEKGEGTIVYFGFNTTNANGK